MFSPEDRYWYITSSGRVEDAIDTKSFVDSDRREFGNYFSTDKKAMRARDKIKGFIKKI